MKKVYLENLILQNYRNFQELSLSIGKNINIIVGPNGSGKTNILESISLLAPGKGLKGTHFDDICKSGEGDWYSAFRMQSKLGSAEIETSFAKDSRSRKMDYNGSKIQSTELTTLLNVIWLTPQMEGLFLGGALARRKFLDRIVYNFDAKHAKRITKYDHLVRERNKTLSQIDWQSHAPWLSTIEKQIAEEAHPIDKARRDAAAIMQKTIDELDTEFPKADLEITLLSEEQDQWDDFLESYCKIMEENRRKDAYSGRTNFGVHKSDLLVFHQLKQSLAKTCSTGEQKALLISISLASIESTLQNTETTPILLLDELFVHLDDRRTKYLADYINKSDLQTFITTTDIVGIEELASKAQIIEL